MSAVSRRDVALTTTQLTRWLTTPLGDRQFPIVLIDGIVLGDHTVVIALGVDEVYVGRFPDLGDRVRISTGGGTAPLWSQDGTELYYRAGRAMMAVAVETGASFTAGRPETLFEGPYLDDLARNYDLAPDGRFLMIKPAD